MFLLGRQPLGEFGHGTGQRTLKPDHFVLPVGARPLREKPHHAVDVRVAMTGGTFGHASRADRGHGLTNA